LSNELIVDNGEIKHVAKALSSETRLKMLKLIENNPLSLSEIARQLEMSPTNIQIQMKFLEYAGLVKSHYKAISQGISKICESNINKVVLLFGK
jgi:predicted transcriptional regulator